MKPVKDPGPWFFSRKFYPVLVANFSSFLVANFTTYSKAVFRILVIENTLIIPVYIFVY